MNKNDTAAQTSANTSRDQELRAPGSFPVEVKSGVKAGRTGDRLIAEPA